VLDGLDSAVGEHLERAEEDDHQGWTRVKEVRMDFKAVNFLLFP